MRLLKIGRSSKCDITISSERVSSLHAEMTLLNNGDILLEDKGSTNGTFVQNRPIKPGKSVSVRRGDAIRFADVELQWAQVPMESNAGYKAVWGIGTDFHNDFQVAGATVSRFHATVKQSNDGKFYIFDHSTNGTTVDGVKIMPNTAHQIKKKSIINCGGVNVDLTQGDKIPWPKELWMLILAIVAAILLAGGIGFGIYKLTQGSEPTDTNTTVQADTTDSTGNGDVNDGSETDVQPPTDYIREKTDDELFKQYNHSVVMLLGIYHYEISVGNWDMDVLNKVLGIPKRFVLEGSIPIDVSILSPSQLVSIYRNSKDGSQYGATGFFISKDGKIATNLHVVKPWLFNNSLDEIRHYVATLIAAQSDNKKWNSKVRADLRASVSEVMVEGVLDYIALIPQGETFDESTIYKCRVIAAGDDIDKDVALVQTISKRLPTSDCTIVEFPDALELSMDAIPVGSHVYTIGFPKVKDAFLQREADSEGIQVIAQGGSINQIFEFDFGHNAATTGGASGSPIFNKYGKLVGIHHAGLSQRGLQGFNYGVKAKYIKELWDQIVNK